MRAILFIMIGISVVFGGDIFIDKSTGLIWQDNSDTKSVEKNWSGAKSYCKDLTLDNKIDWRLPNLQELQSIVDENNYSPAIKDDFKNVEAYYYWSSSEVASDSSQAWSVMFRSGSTYFSDRSFKYNVRCVRGRE